MQYFLFNGFRKIVSWFQNRFEFFRDVITILFSSRFRRGRNDRGGLDTINVVRLDANTLHRLRFDTTFHY